MPTATSMSTSPSRAISVGIGADVDTNLAPFSPGIMHRSVCGGSLFHALVCLAVAGALVAGCARPEPHVVLPEQVIGEPAFVATVEAHTGAPVVAGNAVELLLNGDEFFPAM